MPVLVDNVLDERSTEASFVVPSGAAAEHQDRLMRILVEPSDYILRNAGDTAMLQVAVSRLSRLWPDSTIRVFSDVPEQFPSWAPNAAPMSTEGRRAWLYEPFLVDLLPGGLTKVARDQVWRIEQYLRHEQPWLARRLLKASLRRRERDAASVDVFFEAIEKVDVVIANGMGGVTDVFPEYAYELLQVLRLAQDHGAVTAMVGQGLGPLDDDANLRALATAVLRKVDLIALRERRAGLPLLRDLGVDESRVLTTGDEAVETAYTARPPRLGSALGINVRAASYAGVDGRTLESLRPTLHRLREELQAPLVPIAISTVPGEEDAVTAGELLQESVESSVEPDLERILEHVARCRVVIVGSYHAAVFALSMGVPAVGLYGSLYYRDKFLGLADMFGSGCWALPLDLPNLETALLEMARTAWHTAEELRPQLLAAAAEQIENGHATYDRLRVLVESRRTVSSHQRARVLS
jgi:polysaccharide pyruvyl transferase WcaK-like protein